jgi:hypothetical protein
VAVERKAKSVRATSSKPTSLFFSRPVGDFSAIGDDGNPTPPIHPLQLDELAAGARFSGAGMPAAIAASSFVAALAASMGRNP